MRYMRGMCDELKTGACIVTTAARPGNEASWTMKSTGQCTPPTHRHITRYRLLSRTCHATAYYHALVKYQPVVTCLCPLTLMLLTFGNLKSHSRSGYRNGAMKPPEAASTCTAQQQQQQQQYVHGAQYNVLQKHIISMWHRQTPMSGQYSQMDQHVPIHKHG